MSTLAATNLKHASSASNNIVLDSSGRALIGVSSANANGGILQLSSGITLPSAQVASTDPNTLDDYEEGTWTPNQGAGLTVTGAFSSDGHYTKIGNLVYVRGYVQGATSVSITAGGILTSNLPFTSANNGNAGNATNYNVNQTSGVYITAAFAYCTSALTGSLQILFGFTYRST